MYQRLLVLIGAGILSALLGCRAGPSTAGITDSHFYPTAPDLPRVQYLRSLNGSVDLDQSRPVLDYLAGFKRKVTYEISKAFSVATCKGRIYITDSYGARGVNVFDIENGRFFILGATPGPGKIQKPIHISSDALGYKYVSDLNRKQVVVFGPDDTYVRAYGDRRSFKPIACVTYGDEVYILDADYDVTRPPGESEELRVRRDQIVVLDKRTGRLRRRIGRHGRGKDGFSFASFMAVDRLGNLYVSDSLNHRLVKLDAQGNVLLEFGRHGDQPGDFAQMKGVAVDRDGLIYVVDAAFQVVQVFDNAGRPVFAFGGPRAPIGPMDLPAGISIDYQNLDYFKDYFAPDFEPKYLLFVTNQLSKEHRVSVYAYGRRSGENYAEEEAIVTLEEARDAKPLWQLPAGPVR